MDLIRLTRINIIYTRRRYIHYILLWWLALTRNISKKNQHINILYENKLNIYMHMAEDLFGNNKNENQSEQDAVYEVANTDKYIFKDYKDVSITEGYLNTKLIYISNIYLILCEFKISNFGYILLYK